MNVQELSRATGAAEWRAESWLHHIESAMSEFDINTPARKAMFLAQIGHESGGLRWIKELWGPTPSQSRYEGRADLGNTVKGDGFKFRGRGLIQVTGRDNYRNVGEALGFDLLKSPELLSGASLAARSAAWWWKSKGLNQIADTGNVRAATRRVNGGENGLAERMALYAEGKKVFV